MNHGDLNDRNLGARKQWETDLTRREHVGEMTESKDQLEKEASGYQCEAGWSPWRNRSL